MRARFWKVLNTLDESFWVRPAALVVIAILLGLGVVEIETAGLLPSTIIDRWLYSGSEAGARSMMGAIASSSIGVVGTVFSITIAALTLASNQMGPRLLRNFTTDRGNQYTLGIFLGTFGYCLIVLRNIRGGDNGVVPHLAVTISMLLAFLCIGVLIYFVHHIATRINVDTVIDLVHRELKERLSQLTFAEPQPEAPPGSMWAHSRPLADSRSGYLQQLDESALADWAEKQRVAVRLLVRPGDFIFPGMTIALVPVPAEGAEEAVRQATALGSHRVIASDLEFAVDQLVEVAVRALSPGINDPNTAIAVVDRLGASLCELTDRHLPSGVTLRDGRPVLMRDATSYEGLTDAMFHKIRQNGGSQPAVLIRMLEVLTIIAARERRPDRLAALSRHADLIWTDGDLSTRNPRDKDELAERLRRFRRTVSIGDGTLMEVARGE